MKKIIKAFSSASCVFSLIYYLFIGYFYFSIPSDFTAYSGEEFSINGNSLLSAEIQDKIIKAERAEKENQNVSIKLLGAFPVKEATLNFTKKETLHLGGTPFGVKFLTNGVLVSAITDVLADGSLVSPAKSAGILAGDLILTIGGKAVGDNEDVVSAVNASLGKPVEIKVLREKEELKFTLTPVLTSDGSYKIGIWVKDSAAGIGTLTFSLPKEKIFAGLGHAICDSASGEIMNILSGEITEAEIFGVIKGEKGAPGELKGRLTGKDTGLLKENCECGVFGSLLSEPQSEEIELGFKQSIMTGEAEIVSTVDTSGPKRYKIIIEKINLNDDSLTKNMIIKITDPDLLEKTGGIVQGMSGSPIIQNGRLIGAVTHVFVNDPTRGYGIFSENMLSTAKNMAKENLKEAS